MSKNEQPYIFISYAHKDIAIISPFISALKEKYAVWFDEGIRYGREWEDEIASKLENCCIFIYAITKNSLDSANCKDELSLARDTGKRFLNVMFSDDIELPGWFKLRYGRYQMCYYNRFSSPQEVVADLAKKCEWFEDVRLLKESFQPQTQGEVKYETIRYDNGDVYEGETLNGKKHGKGKMTLASGDVYEGEWKEDKMHGNGKMTLASGAVYEGEGKENQANGKGKFTYDNGDVYEGEFLNGERHGKGKYTYVDGTYYEGDWMNGKSYGKGKQTYPDGDVYEGDWVNDKRHGKGKYTFADGTVYEGEWKKDRACGKGIITYADGDVCEGSFRKLKFFQEIR